MDSSWAGMRVYYLHPLITSSNTHIPEALQSSLSELFNLEEMKWLGFWSGQFTIPKQLIVSTCSTIEKYSDSISGGVGDSHYHSGHH